MVEDENHTIHMTNLNIRVSISILVARLILIDLFASIVIISFYFIITSGNEILGLDLSNTYLFLILFGTLGSLKLITTIYIVLQWLNEYYEITHDAVVHRSGIFFKKREKYNFSNVRAMNIQNSIFGQIFNYGTITLFDMRMKKYLDMYQIHNPNRYVKVTENLRPEIEVKEASFGIKNS